jgi:hypothetical protein
MFFTIRSVVAARLYMVCKQRAMELYQEERGKAPENTVINPSTLELNPSAQRCLTRFLYWGFCYFNRVVLTFSAVPQEEDFEPSERCSIEEQSIEYCRWAFCV